MSVDVQAVRSESEQQRSDVVDATGCDETRPESSERATPSSSPVWGLIHESQVRSCSPIRASWWSRRSWDYNRQRGDAFCRLQASLTLLWRSARLRLLAKCIETELELLRLLVLPADRSWLSVSLMWTRPMPVAILLLGTPLNCKSTYSFGGLIFILCVWGQRHIRLEALKQRVFFDFSAACVLSKHTKRM